MATQGPSFPGTGASVDRAAGQLWATPENITADDTSYAVQNASGATDYLVASNFGFTIPADARIDGVTVLVAASESGGGSGSYVPQLISAATPTLIGAAKSAVTVTGTTMVESSNGGAADLWSATLTPAIVNATGFGVAIWSDDISGNTHSIDYVKIQIDYTLITVTTGLGALTITGNVPTVRVPLLLTTSLGQLTITGYAPDVLGQPAGGFRSLAIPWVYGFGTANKAVTTGLGQLVFTGLVPVITATDNKTVTTGLGQLTITGVVPTSLTADNKSAVPGLGELTITGQVPTLLATDNQFVTAGLGQLTITGYAPQSGDNPNITTGFGELTITGYAPTPVATVDKGFQSLVVLWPYGLGNDPGTVITDTGSLVLTGYAPVVISPLEITAGLGQITLTGLQPSAVATDNQFASPGLGQLTLAGYVPTVAPTDNVFVTIGLGELTITGFAPQAGDNLGAQPGSGSLVITGLVPSVSLTQDRGFQSWSFLSPYGFGSSPGYVYPEAGSLVITGYAPTVLAPLNITSDVGTLTITGYSPAINVAGNTTITTDTGSLTIAGYMPSQTLTLPAPLTAVLVLTGYAPTVGIPNFITTGLGQLTLTGYAPTVAGPVQISSGLGELTITGLVPTVSSTLIIQPDLGELTITGYAPAISATANHSITSGLGQLDLTGLAPNVLATDHKWADAALAQLLINCFAPGVAIALPARYVIGDGSLINGDGTSPDPATVPGGVGAYTTPPGASFATGIEWRMIAGNTLDMGVTGLTTDNSVTIVKYGTGANMVIRGTNAVMLDSSTASNVSISGISIVRTGAVSGVGYRALQTTNVALSDVTITGSGNCLEANDAVGLTVLNCTLGASSTETGIYTSESTTTCSNWSITGTAFNGGVGIQLQASNAANAAGRFTGLVIDSNTFTSNLGSSLVMQSVMNLTEYENYIEVTDATTIVMNTVVTAFPAWTGLQEIFLAGFSNPINFGLRTVVSVVGNTLTVSGAALAVEGNNKGKGIFLRDAARAFISPEIANNVCTGNGETPMLLASISGGRIHHNTITNGTATATDAFAAAIELQGFWNGTIVDYNTIDNISLGATQQVDGAGIFTDGACDGVTVSNNIISNCYGRAGVDNSGQGTGFFHATNCTHENNTITNCYRGTWAGGTGGTSNIIRNNTYRDSDYGIFINCSVPVGVFDYLTGHTFENNVIDIYSCPDGFTQQGTPRQTTTGGWGYLPNYPRRKRPTKVKVSNETATTLFQEPAEVLAKLTARIAVDKARRKDAKVVSELKAIYAEQDMLSGKITALQQQIDNDEEELILLMAIAS